MNNEVKSLVEEFVTVRDWHSDFANVTCPLGHDAICYCDRAVPHLHCLHEKCQREVAEINREFWTKAGDLPEAEKAQPTAQEIRHLKWKKKLARIRRIARRELLPTLRSESVASWSGRYSGLNLKRYDVKDHWVLLLAHLFKEEDLLWSGDLYESGADYAHRFRTVGEWLRSEEDCPGTQISTFTFLPEVLKTGSRSKKFTRERKYLVVECDEDPFDKSKPYDKALFGSVVRWLEKFVVLRALVDTGGKSIHAWFDVPNYPHLPQPKQNCVVGFNGRAVNWLNDDHRELNYDQHSRAYQLTKLREKREWTEYESSFRHACRQHGELLAVLEGLGCDPKMLRFNITARLPGIVRPETGTYQKLLYLNPKFYPL